METNVVLYIRYTSKNRLIEKEIRSVVTRGGAGGRGIKRYKPPVIKYISHRNVIYSIRNMVNNIAITLYGDKWLLDSLW